MCYTNVRAAIVRFSGIRENYPMGLRPQTKLRLLQAPVLLRFITLPFELDASIIIPLPI